MAWAYLERAAADNVVRCEIFFDPQTHTERGVAMQTVIDGLHRALGHAKRDAGTPQYCDACFTGEYPIPLRDLEPNQDGPVMALTTERSR